jgi:ParB family chromosome partitioning protein
VGKRKRRGAAPEPRGLSPAEAAAGAPPPKVRELFAAVEQDGGSVVGAYRDPLGGHWQALVLLPIERVEPTPFQRDLSASHVERLGAALGKLERFLDPILCVRGREGTYWTPNGNHRLAAMRALGARAITALLVPEEALAYEILALNTEKAHNLRERALEVIRIYKGLLEEDGARPETDFGYYLDESALVTLGLCYEKKGNFAGGAYAPILRRLETFSGEPIRKAIAIHEKRAGEVFELDELVTAAADKLKTRGLVSPYLRTFVVARINPLRWIKSDPPPLEEVLKTMRERAAKFNTDKIEQKDLAAMGGPPDEG